MPTVIRRFTSWFYRRRRITLLFIIVVVSLVFFSNHVIMLSTVSAYTNSVDDLFVFKSRPPKQPSCVEKRNFVFIKQMKCATSTLLGTWYRFGYKRNLSFVSPLGTKLYLNWPYPMTKIDFRPSSVGYNILTEHSIYTPDVMEAIMPNDTVFLSIVRNPFDQVKSIFQYFKMAPIAGVPLSSKNIFVEYFSNFEKYETKFKSPEASKSRFCIPTGFSLTKNLMSHCLGMPLGFPPGSLDISQDKNKVDEFIKFLDTKFSLIMIVEYFYESLILLRRMMCWKFNDILFMNANVAQYSFDTKNIPQNIREFHKELSSVDYRLYDHFNKTFWEKVSKQTDDFFDEVTALKKVSSKVKSYCNSVYPLGERPYYRFPWAKQFLKIEASNWTSEFKIHPEDCWMLGPDPYKLYRLVQIENDVYEKTLLEQHAKIRDGRRREEKGLC